MAVRVPGGVAQRPGRHAERLVKGRLGSHVLKGCHVRGNVGSLEYMKPNTILLTLYAYLRLSRENDGSSSIDTQRAAYLAWMEGGEFTRYLQELGITREQVRIVEYIDNNVSGSKPLEARKQMRALMQDVDRTTRLDRAHKHMMIAWKLDRYARSVSEFLRLAAWGEARSVRIATTDNTINTATPTGRMVAVVLAALAEWEREMIKSRIIDGHATRRAQGRWGAGQPPFGYDIERRDGAAYLVVNEEKAAIIRKAIAKLLDDGSVARTAQMTGLSDPQWRRLLKSPTLRGYRAHKGELVLAEDGITPIKFAEPIINAAEAKAIRDRLLALATGENRAPRSASNMAHGMVWCYFCDKPLNGGGSDKKVRLYKCKWGHVTMYAETLDAAIEAEFLEKWGSMAEHVVQLEGGNDLSGEMEEAKEQAKRLAARMASAGPLMMGTLDEMSAELEATYAALRAAHDPDVREVLVPTGRTLADAWKDEKARPRLLADVGLHVVLYKKERQPQRYEISWAIGGDDHELTEMLGDMDWEAHVS